MSCLGSCAATCCCSACKCCPEGKTNSRAPYLGIMFLGTVLALVLRYWAGDWVINLGITDVTLCDDECNGFEAAYRVSFVLFLFFAVHYLALLSKGGYPLHSGLWPTKITGLILMLCLCLFIIPNDFFDIYATISRFVAGLFILIEIIIIIDFAYSWSEKWIEEERYKAIIGVSVFCYGGAIALLVGMTYWFSNGDCSRNDFFMYFTLILSIFISLLSFSERNNGSLLTSSIIALYLHYLCYSALLSDPSTCNDLSGDKWWQVAIGIIIAGATVCYAGWNLSNAKSLFDDADEDAEERFIATADGRMEAASGNVELGAQNEERHEAGENVDWESEEAEEFMSRQRKFHFVMAVASMYLAMLITNWGYESQSSDQSWDGGDATTWVKIITLWVTVALYSWSLLKDTIPWCAERCGDRDEE